MRDPERIDEILDLLRVLWKYESYMRLGQIISGMAQWRSIDPFYIEDDVLKQSILRNLSRYEKVDWGNL